ncbi:EpsG family protein [Pediococcus pentosaceus]|uniref:EpsG family protein n=1 Tax=Pediococcus pentosaceus TaxID=1255 RepID=UPI00211BF74A|nr:EpsG family protein [Pediococcus pentosaceus]MCQ9316721.1 EpsG family protein [Pediococcus pentosaceus]MCQ9339207.1 EpsG family protein [Pediococcus pentosaceus]
MNFGIVYILLLILVLVLGLLFGKNHLKMFFFISDILISLPAFFVRPISFQYFDTIRFSNLLDQIRGIVNVSGSIGGLQWALQNSEYHAQPLVAGYLWIFSLLKYNGFLFGVTTFIFLMFLSGILLNIEKIYPYTSTSLIVIKTVILMTFNLFFQIEGIRNFLAFIIFAFALTEDVLKNSKKNKLCVYILYLIAVLIHPSTLIFVVIRIIVGFRQISIFNTIFYDCFWVLFFLMYNRFIELIVSILQKFSSISFINYVYLKSQSYLYGQANYKAYASQHEIIFTSLILVILFIEFIFYMIISRKENAVNRAYIIAYLYSIAFTIGSFQNTQVYLRAIEMILFLSIPLKARLFNFNKANNNVYIVLLYEILIVFFAIVAFAFWYTSTYVKVLI